MARRMLAPGGRPASPVRELLGIFHDVYRYFVVGLERLPGAGAERLHAALAVGLATGVVCFKVEPALVDDPEEDIAAIEPVSAEHGAAGDATETVELIQHEVFEAVRLDRH